ncbi:MAG: DUF4838 domain-containing protein [Bryobacteraceae bacterium]
MRTIILILFCAACGAQTLKVAGRGQPAAVVVLGRQPSEDDRFAAGELVKYVRKTSGAALQVVSAPEKNAGVRIYVGPGVCPEASRNRLERLRAGGYLVEALPDGRIVLAGKGRHGTSFAVYEFLERFAGVRWLWPGDLGEVAPKRPTIEVAPVSLAREPAFLWRGLGPGGALWGPADRWRKERELGVSTAHQAEQSLWERRNRFGGELIYGGHAFGEILPPAKYGPAHPEYYALFRGERDWKNFNGKHRAQLCTSNPEVVRLVIEYCRRMFDRHPEYDGVSISPNDGRGFCECERCQRLDTGEMQRDRDDPDTGRGGALRVISDRMVDFANQVAEGVAQSHPSKKVVLFAYSQYRQPPKRTRAHSHLIVQYAVNCAGFWNSGYRERMLAEIEGWSRVAPNLGVYEYLTQTNFPDIPRLIPDLLALELRHLEKLGARYYQTQAGNGFAVNGLNFYVLARLLWDPSADCREIVAGYVKDGFGAAAPAVRRYFNRHIEHWKSLKSETITMNDASVKTYEAVLGAYPPAFREACRGDLQEALRAAAGDARKRVEFLWEGFTYFDMTMEAAAKTLPLLRAGWKPASGLAGPGAAAAAALRAWEERDRFIERHKEDFVLSYMWIRSNDETRTFNPLRRVRSASK